MLALSISVWCLSFVRILCSAEGLSPTFTPTFVCTLHFLCAKIWLFGKLVVLLHCKEQKCLLWMFHGVMAALEFLVLSVPVRIGVEQLPLPPESCSLSLLARLFFLSSVYTTLLFLCMCVRVMGKNSMVYNSLHFCLFLLRIHGCLFCKLATCR